MRAVVLTLSLTACLSTPSRPAERSDARSDSPTDGAGAPTMATTSSATVDTKGLVGIGNPADGTHLVFVDNTPGKNGNLVIFGVGDDSSSFFVYVSADHGATWNRHMITPANAGGINDMGACQDSVAHAFHVTWTDSGPEDQYARLVPGYIGGDITGFTVATVYSFFNSTADSPGPRDLAEVIDGAGTHRIAFIGTETSSGSSGLFKLAISSPTAGVAPTVADWTAATSLVASDDALVLNNYPTTDTPPTFMASMSTNLAGGPTAPFIVAAGFPVDRKLLTWIITPTTGGVFTISGPQTLLGFGGGDGIRAHASLSVSNAPSGEVWMLYGADMASLVPGLHLAKLDTAGTFTPDVVPQPTNDPAVRHGVIATDSSSHPAVIYYDGVGAIAGRLLWDGSWSPAVQLTTAIQPIGAWSISNPWQAPSHAFGYYASANAMNPTTFSWVEWK